MSEYSYPEFWIRENCMATNYSEIAIDAYCDVITLSEKIAENDYSINSMAEYHDMRNKTVVSVVFSAMCIEALINDCAATVFGDDFFYGNFDKLSVIGKLQLISKFMFQKELEKDKAHYGSIKSLFKKRDAFAHSKSKQVDFEGYTEEELDMIHKEMENAVWVKEPAIPIENVKRLEKESLDSLLAVKSIAEFLDHNDVNIRAVGRLFLFQSTDKKVMQRKAIALQRLGIKG